MTLPAALQPSDLHPFNRFDVPTLLAQRAVSRRDHVFIAWEPFEGRPQTWTFGEFHHQVGRIAGGLARRGVAAGDRVLIHLDNCPETLLAWYACAWLGAVAVTTNARAADDELAYYAEHCGAVAAITQPKFAERVAAHCKHLRWVVVTATDNGAAPARPVEAGQRFETLDADPPPRRAPDPLAPCSVQYTSGTTSRPKAVLWTHANALWGARINAVHEDLQSSDVHLVHLPLFHTNAQAYSVLACLWAGATAVVLPRFSASRFWPISLKHRCTWVSMIPFCIKALMTREVPAAHPYRLWGAAACDLPTDPHFRVQTIGWWGMTETISQGIVSCRHLPSPSLTIGRPAPEYGIAVVDDDERPVAEARAIEPGGSGQLLVRGIRGLSGQFYRRRLVPHRRPGGPAARRLDPLWRPQQGHAQGGWRKRRRVRDRARDCRRAGCARVRGGGAQAPHARRGAGGVCAAAAGCSGRPGRPGGRSLCGPTGRLQAPARGAAGERAASLDLGKNRQGRAAPPARNRGPGGRLARSPAQSGRRMSCRRLQQPVGQNTIESSPFFGRKRLQPQRPCQR
jgi:crotonobetaine/carnitine-CoA ligase